MAHGVYIMAWKSLHSTSHRPL